jgi:hypothetical protein
MENQNFATRFKQASLKIIKRILIIAFFVGIATMSFLYWGEYEKGVMA